MGGVNGCHYNNGPKHLLALPMIVASARAFGLLPRRCFNEPQPDRSRQEGVSLIPRKVCLAWEGIVDCLHQERHNRCYTCWLWALQCALPPGPCSLLAETNCPAHSPPPPLLRPLPGEGDISLFPGPGRPGSFGNGLLCQRLLSTLHFLPVFGYWLHSGKLCVIMKHILDHTIYVQV